jgi:hypothetical protein
VSPQQQKLKLLMLTWIKPFKLLMVAKISTSNHSTVPLSCIMYLKNITTKLYMHGVNWQFLARSPDTLCSTIRVSRSHYRQKHRYCSAALRHITFESQSHLSTVTETIYSGAQWRKNLKFGFPCTYRCHMRVSLNYWTIIRSILNLKSYKIACKKQST